MVFPLKITSWKLYRDLDTEMNGSTSADLKRVGSQPTNF